MALNRIEKPQPLAKVALNALHHSILTRELTPGVVYWDLTEKMETDGFVYADRCTCELVDQKLERSLGFSYNVVPMNYMK